MSEWKEYKLVDITEPVKDTYTPNGSEDLNYIGLEHIEQETLRLNGIGKSGEVTSNKFLFKSNDVLFGKLRVYFRKVVKPQFNGICSTDIWVLRTKEGFDQDFLFYFIANWDFVNLADGGEGGTRMPRADWNFLKNTIWNIPQLPEQKAIAEILSSLDDKIDLLHRQNLTLEQMAETLFRQWFVEEDSELKPLSECIKTTSGGTPSRKRMDYYENGIHPWIKSKELIGGYILETEEKINDEALKNSSAKLLPENSVLIAMYGATVGQFAIIGQEATCNQAICACIPNEDYPYTFVYHTIKSNVDELKSRAIGSAQQNISQVLIKSLDIAVNDNIGKFHLEVDPMMKKIKANYNQIRTLEKLRDTLLPKLMSGEISLKSN